MRISVERSWQPEPYGSRKVGIEIGVPVEDTATLEQRMAAADDALARLSALCEAHAKGRAEQPRMVVSQPAKPAPAAPAAPVEEKPKPVRKRAARKAPAAPAAPAAEGFDRAAAFAKIAAVILRNPPFEGVCTEIVPSGRLLDATNEQLQAMLDQLPTAPATSVPAAPAAPAQPPLNAPARPPSPPAASAQLGSDPLADLA